jgi:hypothetical protein
MNFLVLQVYVTNCPPDAADLRTKTQLFPHRMPIYLNPGMANLSLLMVDWRHVRDISSWIRHFNYYQAPSTLHPTASATVYGPNSVDDSRTYIIRWK